MANSVGATFATSYNAGDYIRFEAATVRHRKIQRFPLHAWQQAGRRSGIARAPVAT